MTGMMPDSGVPCGDAKNSLCDADTINCNELWYSTSRCQPRFDPAAANAVLAELINLVNCADIPYDCSKLDNLCRAINAMFQKYAVGQTIKVYAVAGVYAWVVPEGVKTVHVKLWGGGGGGGGHALDDSNPYCGHAGAAGGSGGFASKTVKNLVPGTIVQVTVGAGGAGGGVAAGTEAEGKEDGLPGGTSSFGTHVSATGGNGGNWGQGGPWLPSYLGTNGLTQHNPAIGIGGDINSPGSDGQRGGVCWQPMVGGLGGNGGTAPGGGGGGGVGSTTYGSSGTPPGGGGAGAGGGTPFTTLAGNGGVGWVILEWVDLGVI